MAVACGVKDFWLLPRNKKASYPSMDNRLSGSSVVGFI
jgi:hypothetical protein